MPLLRLSMASLCAFALTFSFNAHAQSISHDVSTLFETALGYPDRVDSTVRRYRTYAVQACLRDIVSGNVAGATWHRRMNDAINRQFGTAQPSMNAQGELVVLAASLLAATQGTPWYQTTSGSSDVQIAQALNMLGAGPLWGSMLQLRRNAVAQARRERNGLLVSCRR